MKFVDLVRSTDPRRLLVIPCQCFVIPSRFRRRVYVTSILRRRARGEAAPSRDPDRRACRTRAPASAARRCVARSLSPASPSAAAASSNRPPGPASRITCPSRSLIGESSAPPTARARRPLIASDAVSPAHRRHIGLGTCAAVPMPSAARAERNMKARTSVFAQFVAEATD